MSGFTMHHGDCLEVLRSMADNSVDSIVTDPPYGLSFMGKRWDYDVPSVEVWAECLRVLKPGGHLLAFAGTRTQHRMAVRIEDAGFEIRDMIAWVYGSGFPKSLDVSKAIDKLDAADARRERQLRFTAWIRGTGLTAARIDEITGTNMGGHYTTAASQPSVATREYFEMLRPYFGCDVPAWVEQLVDERTVESENFKRRQVVGTKSVGVKEGAAAGSHSWGGLSATEVDVTAAHTEAARQWQGWGTAIKPALEPITVARKPLEGTVAANVLQFGAGALNIDGCRVGIDAVRTRVNTAIRGGKFAAGDGRGLSQDVTEHAGRWPANVIHDGSEEVLAGFPDNAGAAAPVRGTEKSHTGGEGTNCYGEYGSIPGTFFGDTGSAARFFYCAKASKADRDDGLEGFDAKEPRHAFGDGLNTATKVRTEDQAANGVERGARRNTHPTVKPTALMRYLCRLVTPPGGTVLDPFTGSGSTGKAALLEGFQFIGIEREAEYVEIARARIAAVRSDAIPATAQDNLFQVAQYVEVCGGGE